MISTWKRCLIGFLIWGYENLLLPPKKLDLWPKNDQNWHFWQIWSYVWPKNNADKLPKCFFHYLVTKTFTYYHKKYDFWPKNGQILPKICIFGYFGPNIGIFCPFCPGTIGSRWVGGFSVIWVWKLLISPVKIRLFCPKITIFGLNLAFLFILG